MSVQASETTLHRALGDERRARIVRELQSADTTLDATQLGDRLRLHPNTVRWHLGILTGAGLVRSRAAARRTPGRPRVVYELDPGAARAERDEYRLLATVLAEIAARTADGAAASEEAGRVWGRRLVRRPEPAPTIGEEDAIARVGEVLAEQGFEPTVEERRIEMHRCPFHELAETSSEIVCAVHRGLISGALAGLGQQLAVGELEIFPRPDVCIAHLAAP